MGKGDKKTKRGKIIMGSSGKLRLKKNKKTLLSKVEEEIVVKPINKSTLTQAEKKAETAVEVKKSPKVAKTTASKKTKKEE